MPCLVRDNVVIVKPIKPLDRCEATVRQPTRHFLNQKVAIDMDFLKIRVSSVAAQLVYGISDTTQLLGIIQGRLRDTQHFSLWSAKTADA